MINVLSLGVSKRTMIKKKGYKGKQVTRLLQIKIGWCGLAQCNVKGRKEKMVKTSNIDHKRFCNEHRWWYCALKLLRNIWAGWIQILFTSDGLVLGIELRIPCHFIPLPSPFVCLWPGPWKRKEDEKIQQEEKFNRRWERQRSRHGIQGTSLVECVFEGWGGWFVNMW